LARFVGFVLDRHRRYPDGVALLMAAVWGRNARSAGQLARIAAEARHVLRPLGFTVERFQVEGVANVAGYRIARAGTAS
jgi:hypothetical protein